MAIVITDTEMKMKKILVYLSAAILSLGLISCKKTSVTDISGEWHMVSSGETDMEQVDVYLSFTDGNFEIYQKLGNSRYWIFSGTYTVTGNTVTGKYSDGSSWGSYYESRLENDGSVLVLTALNGSAEESVYNRTPVPDEVKAEAVPAVKSGADENCPVCKPIL